MRYRLADHGLVFSTRDRGARILADMREKLGDRALETMVIDFAGVKSISYSFADECIGTLIQQADAAAAYPSLVNMPPSAARTVERSLRRRGLDADRALSDSLETA